MLILTLMFAALLSVRKSGEALFVGSYEWGVHFERSGEAPTPNLSAQELKKYNSYYCGDTCAKVIYITFDAGYENGNTTALLDALKKHNATAAFFVVGPFIKENPALIKRMIDEGHIIGNHTYRHPDMRQKSKNDFIKELSATEQVFFETTGREIDKYYRPPEGKFTTENLQWANEIGYTTVLWSTAYVDWKLDAQPSKEYAFEKIASRTFDGSIILLHTTSATNALILDEQLSKWEAQGYTFASLSQLRSPYEND
ncbi:MAG: polysaccharide deacetylase family protein [Oscillospiraceae bacterium]